MEKVDLEAQLLLEEGGARLNVPHAQDRRYILQERRARRSARRLGCSGRCRFQLRPTLISGFHRNDLLRHGKSELKRQYFAVGQRLVAFEPAYLPANRIVSFAMPAEQQLGLLAVCLDGWHRHIPAEIFQRAGLALSAGMPTCPTGNRLMLDRNATYCQNGITRFPPTSSMRLLKFKLRHSHF